MKLKKVFYMPNCKQGDLAIIIGTPRLDGIIVTCLKSHIIKDFSEEFLAWDIDRTFYFKDGTPHNIMPDAVLFPINPLSEDEKNEFLEDMSVSLKKLDSFSDDNLRNIRTAKMRIEMLKLK